MAQSGYTPILIYASGTATNVPLAANMTSSASGAELALNYADGKLYYKNSSGVVTLLASATTVTNSFSAGTTGFTPNTATTGAVTLAGTLNVANGGTGQTTLATGALGYGQGTSAHASLAIGTAGQILTVNSGATAPQWSTLSGVAVTTFSAGTTGFTPSSATSGAITLAGTLNVANGGTGLTTLTANRLPYGNGTSAFQSSANLTFDGTNLASTTLSIGGAAAPVTASNERITVSNSYDGTILSRLYAAPATNQKYINSGWNGATYGSGGSGYMVNGYNGIYSLSGGGQFISSIDYTAFGTLSANGFTNVSPTFTEYMRLNSTGLGVGTTPAYKLDVDKGSAGIVARFKGGTRSAYIYSDNDAVYFASDTSVATAFGINETTDFLTFYTGNVERGRISPTGNLSIGATDQQGRIASYCAGKASFAGVDTSAYAAGVGGTIDLGGNYRSSNDYSPFVRIAAEKANATNGDYGYNMGFYVTTYPNATFGTKAMTIDSTGNIYVNLDPIGGTSKFTVRTNTTYAMWCSVGFADGAAYGLEFGLQPGHGSYRSAVRGLPENYGGTDSGALAFYTSNSYNAGALTERARFSSVGFFGIGTSSPNRLLTVDGGSSDAYLKLNTTSTGGSIASGILFTNTTNPDGYVMIRVNGNSNDLSFYAGNSERMRITSAGDVNIYNGNSFNCYNPGNARYGSFYTNVNGTVLTSWNGAGEPLSLVSPTGYMTFSTNGSERGRFLSSGEFLVGATTAASSKVRFTRTDGGNVLYVSQEAATNYGTAAIYQTQSGGNNNQNIGLTVAIQAQGSGDRIICAQYWNSGSPQDKFIVQRDGSTYNATGVYGTISDVRVKQDITNASSQWEDFKKIKFRKFRMIDDVEKYGNKAPYLMGPVAQELEEAGMKGLVETPVDKDGNETDLHKTVKLSIMHMKGMKALQEAMERIEQLEARITAANL